MLNKKIRGIFLKWWKLKIKKRPRFSRKKKKRKKKHSVVVGGINFGQFFSALYLFFLRAQLQRIFLKMKKILFIQLFLFLFLLIVIFFVEIYNPFIYPYFFCFAHVWTFVRVFWHHPWCDVVCYRERESEVNSPTLLCLNQQAPRLTVKGDMNESQFLALYDLQPVEQSNESRSLGHPDLIGIVGEGKSQMIDR